ncbi:hypothetical protein Y1Q_0013306 [Alligator mississippiensis]|uniref:Uncharacterized protein n=1 Tax=Alligator mississippiensis TaxID=8496 RepID=A0A151NTB5_ALLMI|nr:hypothetical protein Y1Q_0013306 [Alligator mississippiensis]
MELLVLEVSLVLVFLVQYLVLEFSLVQCLELEVFQELEVQVEWEAWHLVVLEVWHLVVWGPWLQELEDWGLAGLVELEECQTVAFYLEWGFPRLGCNRVPNFPHMIAESNRGIPAGAAGLKALKAGVGFRGYGVPGGVGRGVNGLGTGFGVGGLQPGAAGPGFGLSPIYPGGVGGQLGYGGKPAKPYGGALGALGYRGGAGCQGKYCGRKRK